MMSMGFAVRFFFILLAAILVSPDTVSSFVAIVSSPKCKLVLFSIALVLFLKWALSSLWNQRKLGRMRLARSALAIERKKEVRRQCAKVKRTRPVFDRPTKNLIDDMKTGKLSVVEVVQAFQTEALNLSERLNCVTEPIVEAEALAKQMDMNPDKKGLLYGLPISVKENIAIAGYDSNIGAAKFVNDIQHDDAVAIKVLKHHGAIPFVRTNLPQSMYNAGCKNPVYGQTCHPHDPRRSPGGSSGGEAALVGGGASLVGLGSDVGGSLRVPANFCGAFAFKPTWGRVSSKGKFSIGIGNTAIMSVIGPMAADMQSLMMVSKALLSPKMADLDPSLPALTFDDSVLCQTGPLRIGYYTYDGCVRCFPSSERAVVEAKTALEDVGHELVHFNFPALMGQGFPYIDKFVRIMGPDRGERFRRALAHDSKEPGLRKMDLITRVPVTLAKVLSWIFSPLDLYIARALNACVGFSSVYDYMVGVYELKRWQEAFMKTWQEQKLDAVICPVFPTPAPLQTDIEKVGIMGTYCSLFNCVNFPAGVVPVTIVKREDVRKTFDPKYFAPESVLIKQILPGFKDSAGLGVGVQCAALPFKEEVCLRVMHDLDRALTVRGRNSKPCLG